MLFISNNMTHNLVLLVSLLNRVEADLPVDHTEIRPEILSERVVPVLKPFAGSSGSIVAGVALLFLCPSRIVELIVGPETSVKLIFEGIHELPVPCRLEPLVMKLIIIDVAFSTVVGVTTTASTTFVRL
jgi:hypothetical protein